MAGYTRQSVADIVPTAVVRAAPINAEYNKLRDAFTHSTTGTTGHKHDGSSDEGSYVPLIADLDALNKIVVDTANNRHGVFVEVSAAAVEQIRFQDGVIVPVTDNDIDLGTSVLEFKNLYLDGIAKIDTLTVDENATVTGNLTVNSNTILGDAITDTVTYTARAASNFLPITDATYDLGSSSVEWNNLWIDGTANVDTLQVDESAIIVANLSVGGNVNVTGNNTIAGNLVVNGNTSLGNATTDTVTFTAEVASTIVPSVDSTYTLGSSSKYWSHGYIDAVTTTGNVTVGGAMSVGTTLDMTSGQINNLAAPTLSSDAATKGYVDTAITNVIDAAPGTLDTLNELAAALGDDPNFATTVTNSIATKLALAGGTMTGNIAMGGNKVTGLGTPTSASDAVSKTYVDTLFGDTASAAASAAAAEAAYDSFDDRYLGAKSSSPATDNDGNALITGALYFDTTANLMKVYDGSSWVDAGSAVNGTAERSVYTATSGQTTFVATYDVGFVDVYLNGVKLVNGTDFTATSGTSIVLATGATAGDSVDIVAYGAFSIADVYTQAVSDSRFVLNTNIGVTVQAYDSNLTSFVGAFTLPTVDGSNGQFLQTNGSGTLSFQSVPTINTLDDVGDVTITSAATGQVLSWNGSAWVNSTLEAFDTQTASTSSTSQTAIASYAVASYDGVKAVVTVADSVSGNRTITELIITHDGTTAVATEYAIVNTATKLAEFDVDISAGNVRLLATPASSNSMSFTVKAITL